MTKTLTIAILVLATAALAFAGATAPRSGATDGLCHTTALSIKAPSSVKAGKSVTVKGAEARSADHSLQATLQYRRSSSSKWKNGATALMTTRDYALKWKAPSTKGKYKIRVRVSYSGSSNTSAAKTVTVK